MAAITGPESGVTQIEDGEATSFIQDLQKLHPITANTVAPLVGEGCTQESRGIATTVLESLERDGVLIRADSQPVGGDYVPTYAITTPGE